MLTTKRQTLEQVLVCVGRCCRRTDRGHPAVPTDWLKAQWKQGKLLKDIQLIISGCLGPWDLVNVACIVTPNTTSWLRGLNKMRLAAGSETGHITGYGIN